MSLFAPATREQGRLRLGLVGPSGSGKTYTALRVAHTMYPDCRIAVIDTEHGSASKYVDETSEDGHTFAFDTIDMKKQLGSFSVENYIRCIKEAGKAGYDVLIIDSLSHAWAGEGGVLEVKDKVSAKNRNNDMAGWREATPLHNSLIDEMLSCPCHLIVTMRSKVEWVMESDSKGRMVPRKVGLAPVQRQGLDYEFDVVGDIEQDTHKLMVTKTRCSALSGAVITKPGAELAETLRDWLELGSAPVVPEVWDDVEADWLLRLAEVGLDLEEAVAPYLKHGGRTPRPHPRDMGPEARRVALEWLVGEGRTYVETWVRGLTNDLRVHLMSRWTKLYPIPTQKHDEVTGEQQAAAQLVSDEARREVMRRWWGVDSVSLVSPRALLSGGRTLAWLRGLDGPAFEAAVSMGRAE